MLLNESGNLNSFWDSSVVEMNSNVELGGLHQAEGDPVAHLHSLGSQKNLFKASGAGKAILPQLGFVSILVNHKNILLLLYRIAYGCSRERRGGPCWGRFDRTALCQMNR